MSKSPFGQPPEHKERSSSPSETTMQIDSWTAEDKIDMSLSNIVRECNTPASSSIVQGARPVRGNSMARSIGGTKY
eukprot:7858901-Karenia_brevis.AAC.1